MRRKLRLKTSEILSNYVNRREHYRVRESHRVSFSLRV